MKIQQVFEAVVRSFACVTARPPPIASPWCSYQHQRAVFQQASDHYYTPPPQKYPIATYPRPSTLLHTFPLQHRSVPSRLAPLNENWNLSVLFLATREKALRWCSISTKERYFNRLLTTTGDSRKGQGHHQSLPTSGHGTVRSNQSSMPPWKSRKRTLDMPLTRPLHHRDQPVNEFPIRPVPEGDTAYLHHTSGTSTGLPKPIPQSHRAAVGVLPRFGDGHEKSTFTTTPLYHQPVPGSIAWLELHGNFKDVLEDQLQSHVYAQPPRFPGAS